MSRLSPRENAWWDRLGYIVGLKFAFWRVGCAELLAPIGDALGCWLLTFIDPIQKCIEKRWVVSIPPIAVFTWVNKDLNKLFGFARGCHFLTQHTLSFNHDCWITNCMSTDDRYRNTSYVIDIGCKSGHSFGISLKTTNGWIQLGIVRWTTVFDTSISKWASTAIFINYIL